MGNTICLNMTQQTQITSHFDLKNIQPKSNKQNLYTSHTHASQNKKIGPKIQTNPFYITQQSFLQETENQQHQKTFKQTSFQSIQITDLSKITPTQTKNHTQKQIYTQKHLQLHLKQNSLNSSFYPVYVPFSVILSMLNKKIIHAIHRSHSTFFQKYSNDTKSFQLLHDGCYGHIINQKYGIFISSNYFYQGQFQQNQNGQFLPSSKGTYISDCGKYVGQFEGGKPNGKGKYYQFGQLQYQLNENDENFIQTFRSENSLFSNPNSRRAVDGKIYEGDWKDGQLLSGKIDTSRYRYVGNLKKGRPEGWGKLILKQSKITYRGTFKDGFFDGQHCVYETPNFVYNGDFRHGKKQGLGTLTKKISVTKNNNQKTKYFGQKIYQGVWKNDLLIRQQQIGDRKR